MTNTENTNETEPQTDKTTSPRPPRTPSQRQASALNGTKSQGPKTPAGKAKSAQNARKPTQDSLNPRNLHQTLAQSILLKDESPDAFNDAIESLHRMFLPRDPFEAGLVEMMAVASWRHTRLIEMERAGIQLQILPDSAAALEPAARSFLACQILNRDRSLETLHRQAARLDRQYHLALQRLIDHRRHRERTLEKLQTEHF